MAVRITSALTTVPARASTPPRASGRSCGSTFPVKSPLPAAFRGRFAGAAPLVSAAASAFAASSAADSRSASSAGENAARTVKISASSAGKTSAFAAGFSASSAPAGACSPISAGSGFAAPESAAAVLPCAAFRFARVTGLGTKSSERSMSTVSVTPAMRPAASSRPSESTSV